MLAHEFSLFIGTFTTLLAIINPFEVLPVYLQLLEGKDVATHHRVAWKSCVYALLLSLFFLIFGTMILRLFGVPLAMIRIAGGIILVEDWFRAFFAVSIKRNPGEWRCRPRRKYRVCPTCNAVDVWSGRNCDYSWNDLDD
jgi:small neutral amino acid transporter SnatA (MarC family)